MSENLIGGVTSVVTADTTKFDVAFKKTGETADATARVVAKAAKLQADGIATAAKFAGDAVTEQSLRIIAARKLEGQAQADYQKVQRLVRDGYGGEAEGSTLAAAALQRLTAARLASAEAGKVEHAASVSQQQAASAVIRSAEGNVGIRAVERFAISIPGVGAALQAIFPIVGLVATAGIIVKMGTDLYDLEQKGKHSGDEITRAFSEVNVKLAAGNDELELQTSKIEDEIAKLEKAPTNGLKTSLLEAAVAADRLQQSLAEVLKTEREALKQQSIGGVEAFLSNTGSTKHAEKDIDEQGKDFEKQANLARIARRKALQDSGDDQDKQEAANKAYYDRMDTLTADAARKMRQRATEVAEDQRQENEMQANSLESGATYSARDFTNKRSAYEGQAETYDEANRRVQDAGENFFAEKKRNALVGAKASEVDQNRAAEEQLKGIEAEFDRLSAAKAKTTGNPLTAGEGASFWSQYLTTFKAGSSEAKKVLEEFLKNQDEIHKRIMTASGMMKSGDAVGAMDFLTGEKKPKPDDDGRKELEQAQRALDAMKRNDARAGADRYDTANELFAERQKTLATLEATRVQEASGRTMTQIAAATEMAAIHTREYGAELERLQAKQAAIKNNPLLTNGEADQQRQVDDLDKQIAKVKGNRQVQILQDSYSITAPNSSAMTGARDALDEFTDAAKDNAQIMRSLVQSTLHSFNDELLRAITGQKTDWKGLGRGVATNVASAGLNKAESSVFGALGFGKKDGSTEVNAMWVRLAGAAGSPGGSGMPGVVPFLDTLAGGGKTSGDTAGPNWGKLASTALSFLPGFADGGELPRSSLVMVGERGPEILNTGMAGGSVIPNHKAADMIGGGGGDTHIHIDATGATDPAAVDTAVRRGITEAAPGIAAMAVSAGRERSLRRSSLRR